MSDEKRALIRHLRRHHPNLLSGSISGDDWRRAIERDESLGFSAGPLPEAGLSDVPMVVLSTVHMAAHMGLYFPHAEDDWLCRDHEARKEIRAMGWSVSDATEPGSGFPRPELLEQLRKTNRELTKYVQEAAGDESCLLPISTLATLMPRLVTDEMVDRVARYCAEQRWGGRRETFGNRPPDDDAVCLWRSRARDILKIALVATMDEGEEPTDEELKWLRLDPTAYRGGGVMGRRRTR